MFSTKNLNKELMGEGTALRSRLRFIIRGWLIMSENLLNEMENERKQQKVMQRIRGFRLMDDEFMSACLKENMSAANKILGIILNKPDIEVTKVETQVELKNLRGRSIRLDVRARDKDGVYNCEIQRADKGATPRRARFHGSMLDSDESTKGMLFEDLPETYVIFITEKDYFEKGKPIYRFERYCHETDMDLNDGLHIIYVNGEYKGEDDIGWLMHDFLCTNADDLHYTEIAESFRYLKEEEAGVKKMCRSIEEMLEENAKEVAEMKTLEFAKRMIERNKYSLEDISECTGLSIEEVTKLDAEFKGKN